MWQQQKWWAFFMVVKYIKHKIYHSNHVLVYSSVALSAFTLLCNHYYHTSSELFHLAEEKLSTY